jgi:hypothetical protein
MILGCARKTQASLISRSQRFIISGTKSVFMIFKLRLRDTGKFDLAHYASLDQELRS